MQLMFISEIVSSTILFILIKYITYKITYDIGLSKIFNYMPFICHKCLQFWTLIFLYPILFITFNMHYLTFLIFGLLITILDAIAMHVDEKNNY